MTRRTRAKSTPAAASTASELASFTPAGQPPGAATAAPGDTSTATQPSRLNRISARAYQLYQSRGGQHGLELEDWLEAEREIDGQTGDES